MANYTNMTVELLSDLVRTSIILPIMDKYMLIIIYICGIIGSLFNVITFLQKQFPCQFTLFSLGIDY